MNTPFLKYPMKTDNLHLLKCWRAQLLLLTAAQLSATLALSAQQNDTTDDEVLELSPFQVSVDQNMGYLATSTLAGTRIKTDLRDVGSAISVVTPEMLEDLGASSAEELLVYTVSTEIGGATGNFGGSAVAAGDESANRESRANPESNNRVRGLSKAQSTRDYFLTEFKFDSYNSSGITLSRGPNSILFGIGEPGGIIENSLKKASLSKDFGTISLRIGNRSSHRQTFDYNKVIIDDRVALRVMAVNDQTNFQQKPTYEDDRRLTLTGTWKVLKNEKRSWMGPTILRSNFERAEIRSTPPNPMPPGDAFHYWWHPEASVEADAIVGLDRTDYRADYASQWVYDDVFRVETTPGNKRHGRAGIFNQYAVIYSDFETGLPGIGLAQNDVMVIDAEVGAFRETLPDGSRRITFPRQFRATNRYEFRPNYPGFKDIVMQDPKVFDYNNYFYPGRSQYSNQDFKAYNVSLEQNFFNNQLGFQFAYDYQEKDAVRSFPFGRFNYYKIYIDTGLYLTNGEPNPNVGRPMLAGRLDPEDFFYDERDSLRLTSYYTRDFSNNEGWSRWLGHHTFTGLLNRWSNDKRQGSYGLVPDDSHDPDQRFVLNNFPLGAANAIPALVAYVGDSLLNVSSPEEARFYNDYLNVQLPVAGVEYPNYYYDAFTQSLNYSTIKYQEVLYGFPEAFYQEVDSQGITWQGKFLQDHLIVTYGWRKDDSSMWQTESTTFRDSNLLFDPAVFEEGWLRKDGSVGLKSDADPVLSEAGETKTTQLVLHIPHRWLGWSDGTISSLSFHYADSENFNPATLRRDVLNRVIDNPSGRTKEHGFTIGLFDEKVVARMTWYETTVENINNANIQGQLWQFRWPLQMAQTWMRAKNESLQPGGLSFEDMAWVGTNEVGPDAEGAVYDPSRLGSFTSFDEVINAILDAWGPDLSAAYEVEIIGTPGAQDILFNDPTGRSSVAKSIADGFEIEIVINPTKNWRIALNGSKTESKFGEGLKVVGPAIEMITQNLKDANLWDITSAPSNIGDVTIGKRYNDSMGIAYFTALAQENTVSSELRKWRFNLITNYNFSDGFLKGLGVGGALRWMDKVAIGYPLFRNELDILVPQIEKPFYGDDRLKGDIWFSYESKIFKHRVKYQLNFQNYLGDDGPIPVVKNPDGKLAIIRTAEEKRVFLTATIQF